MYRDKPSCCHYKRLRWIDAICIDQTNTDERYHQVQRMGTIYRDADEVIVWFGDDPRLGWAMSSSKFWLSFESFEEALDSEWRREEEDWDRKKGCIETLYAAIEKYWLRAWIMQEAMLARSLVLLGHTTEFPLRWFHIDIYIALH